LHSATTGLIVEVVTPMAGCRSIAQPTNASATLPTLSVFVSRIGLSSCPSSAICTRPIDLP